MNDLNISWTPEQYNEVNLIEKEAFAEINSRLKWLKLNPKTILHLGCSTCDLIPALRNDFPFATILGIDNRFPLLKEGIKKGMFPLLADGGVLPIKAQSIDLLVVNGLIPWYCSLKTVLEECKKILSNNGILIITAFGLQTLKSVEKKIFCTDIHDLGNLLIQMGFVEPVLDVNHYTDTYADSNKLEQALYLMGMIERRLPKEVLNNSLDVCYEVIFAHAFMSIQSNHDTQIPLTALRAKLRAAR